MTRDNNWGGSAAAGGMNFQAATTAIALAHMSSGAPLLWLQGLIDDTPVAVLAETGSAGDDIRLHLKDQSVVEVQVKKKMSGTAALWETLLSLSAAITRRDISYGVLAVGPSSAAVVRDQLARDIVRLGQGREDDLKAIGKTCKTKLLARGMSVSTVCARLRIVTVHAIENDAVSIVAARGEFARISDSPAAAWDAAYRDAHSLIEFRGKRTANTTLRMLAAAGVKLQGATFASFMALEDLLAQRRAASATFSIPGIHYPISVDLGWIPLKKKRIDRPSFNELDFQHALRRYRERSVHSRSASDGQFDAESTGWFVYPCVVVAGPGMGKSTLLKRLVRSYSSDGQVALVARLAAIARRMEGGAGFYESLMELSLDATRVKKEELELHGLDQITFLLDGLDECGNMQEAVTEALSTFATMYPRTRIVITTRPVGYDTVHLSTWVHYGLVPLDPDQALANIEKILCGVCSEEPAALSEALAFARREVGRGALKLVVDTPLLVSMVGALVIRGMRLGSTRADLYEQMLKLLQSTPDTRVDQTPLSVSVLRRFIALFGWFSLRHPTASHDLVLRQCASELSRELGQTALAGEVQCEACLQWWEAMGMLERLRFRGEESVVFTHKTFGEYCAALYLIAMPEDAKKLFVETSEAVPAWRETIDFACAMGLSEMAVSAALHLRIRGRAEAEAVTRALRRASHSPVPLDEPIASRLSACALKWIASKNASIAVEVGQALAEAASKLPGVELVARPLQFDAKSWTQVAAFACVLAAQPRSLTTSELVNIATPRQAPRGSDWQLWQKMVLLAVKELVSRERDPQVTSLLGKLRNSQNMSVGTLIAIGEMLEEAGVKLPESELEKKTNEFVRESVSISMPGGIALLQAMVNCGGTADPGVVLAGAPPMHLSALISASNLWEQPAREIACWADKRWSETATPILHAFATCVCINLARLRAEAHARLLELQANRPHGSAWEGLVHVDVGLQVPDIDAAVAHSVLEAGLTHQSEWIVTLTAHLIMWSCDESDRRCHAQFAIARTGTTLWAACEIAASLPLEEAKALIVAGLNRPIKEGFQFLFDKLADLRAAGELELSAAAIKSALLSEHAEVTRSAARFLLGFSQLPIDSSLVTSVIHALASWEARERAYDSKFGWVQPSPRPELLKLLIAVSGLDTDAALTLGSDSRPDVQEIAREFLLTQAEIIPGLATRIIEETVCARLDPSILQFLLESSVTLSAEQVATLVQALRSALTPIKISTLPLLRGTYLPVDQRRSLALELSTDEVPELQQAAHQVLDEL